MAMDTVNVSYTDAIEIGTLGRCTCWFIQIITDVTPLIYANGKSLTLLGVSSPSVSMGTWCSNDELMIMASGRETTIFSAWRAHCWCRLAPALTLSIPMRLSSVSWTMIGGVLFVWTELLCCTEHLKIVIGWGDLVCPSVCPLPLQLPLTFWIWATRCIESIWNGTPMAVREGEGNLYCVK